MTQFLCGSVPLQSPIPSDGLCPLWWMHCRSHSHQRLRSRTQTSRWTEFLWGEEVAVHGDLHGSGTVPATDESKSSVTASALWDVLLNLLVIINGHFCCICLSEVAELNEKQCRSRLSAYTQNLDKVKCSDLEMKISPSTHHRRKSTVVPGKVHSSSSQAQNLLNLPQKRKQICYLNVW